LEKGLQHRLQTFPVEIADHATVVCNRDRPSFLRNDESDSVTLLSDTERSPVAQSQLPVREKGCREGEYAGGSQDPPVPDDDSTIVQRGVRIKDAPQ
jgi:hypothetical protein